MATVVLLDDIRWLWWIVGWFSLLLGLQQWRICRLKRALRRKGIPPAKKAEPPP